MYNKRLNDQCTERFRSFVKSKRVLIVGNAASMFSDNTHGKFIDSFDVVVRMGKGYPEKIDSDYLGSKTDVWFFGPGRAGMYKKFWNASWKIYTPSQLKIYHPKCDDCLLPMSMLTDSFQIYDHFFLTGSSTDLLELNRKVNGDQSNKARLSQGIQCVDWFVNKVGSQSSTTLIGFDFFEQTFNHNYDNSRNPDIPSEQPTSSWHCPLISKNYDVNPHAFGFGDEGNEKKYITSLPGIEIVKMPAVDLNKMNEVLKRIRGNSSTISQENK